MMLTDWRLVLAAGIVVLSGCGKDSAPPATAAGPAAPAPVTDAATKAELKGMVSGVTSNKPGAPVDLKFELTSRPEVGKPVTIRFALVPRVPAEQMRLTFLATEGLQLKASNSPGAFHKVQAATVYRHEITLEPRDNGVYYVSAIVLLDTEQGSEARTFSVPVVVGPPPDVDNPAEANAAPADGEPGKPPTNP